jgi:hypothetical protein
VQPVRRPTATRAAVRFKLVLRFRLRDRGAAGAAGLVAAGRAGRQPRQLPRQQAGIELRADQVNKITAAV